MTPIPSTRKMMNTLREERPTGNGGTEDSPQQKRRERATARTVSDSRVTTSPTSNPLPRQGEGEDCQYPTAALASLAAFRNKVPWSVFRFA